MQESRIQIKQVEKGNTEGEEVLARRVEEMQKMMEREWRINQTVGSISKKYENLLLFSPI